MIISFSVSNFLSIKEEQVLSFEASSDESYNEYFIREIGKYRLLKMGIIYGANASGKTNILKALDVLRQLVTRSRDADKDIYYTPFLFDDEYKTGNCKMKLEFLVGDEGKYVKHIYELEFNAKEIVNESLKYYPGQQPAMIYNRVKNTNLERGYTLKFSNGSKPKSEEQNILESSTLINNTILSAFNKVNPIIPKTKRVRKWFDYYMTRLLSQENKADEKTADVFFKKSIQRQGILNEFIKKADYNVSKFIISEGNWKFTEDRKDFALKFGELIYSLDESNSAMSNWKNQIDKITQLPITKKELSHVYKVKGELKEGNLPYLLESNGTKRSFELAAPLIENLMKGKIMILDEIESSLHFDLVKYIILVFLANSENSQMLFTTHNLLLLDWDILRHDVIWFTEKKEDGSTDLYSLADFKELNRSNILKRYLSGQFGAKPDIYDYKLNLQDLKEDSSGKKN
ncbi:MAG: ATP-binding protein [Candidatus Stygibacter australis]|nr:ATP-binding protein [Candidatus Stygibacter australis]MDP8322790.1 ATP-binding protein [Candidatus Stygibacter australis]